MRVVRILFSFLTLLVLAPNVFASKQIQGIKVAPMGVNHTRLTFLLSEPFSLDLEEDPAQNQLIVRGPSESTWDVRDIPSNVGLVTKGELVTSTQGNQSLFLDVSVGTEIDNYGLKKNFKDRHEFFIDLHKDASLLPSEDDRTVSMTLPEKMTDPIRQEPSAFHIEGDEECLSEHDLKTDLKSLQISLSLPDDLAYVSQKVLEEGGDPKPKLLKAFKIAPSEDPTFAKKAPDVHHVKPSNTGHMFDQLQGHQEAQVSVEGTPPDWVIEAKMKEKSL